MKSSASKGSMKGSLCYEALRIGVRVARSVWGYGVCGLGFFQGFVFWARGVGFRGQAPQEAG